jgi:UDP-glucose 4-epimerase
MKVLITGSSGYVGYVLSKYFSEKKIKVIGLDISANSVWGGNNFFKFYNCDVTDKKSLEEIFLKEKPTHVIHLAFLMNPIHDVKREHEIDVVGSINVLEIANKTKSVKQFVLFSSASAYGAWPENKLWIKEDQPLKPRDYRYGIDKKKVEEYYNKFEKRKDINLVTLRMCTAIGPLYHKKGGVVSLLINSPFMTKINNRYCELQFLHEDDLNALMNLIINDEKIQGTYNLAPNSYATTKELAPDKFFLRIPLWLMRGIVRVLWVLRIVDIMPSAITLSAYGIIIDPKKLMERYNYKFKYTTLLGFKDTVEKRKAKGSL